MIEDARLPHTPVTLAEWTYDTLAKGQLTSSTRFAGGLPYVSAVTGYDDGYRPLGTTVSIPVAPANGAVAGTYTESVTYRPDGSLATETLPAVGGLPAETITHTYTDAGQLSSTAGLALYVAGTTYRWDGTVAEVLHGAAGSQMRRSFSYEEATGRTRAEQVDAETSPGVFTSRYTTEYGYDHAGNVRAVAGKTDGARDQVECFRYDHLRRLVEAWTAATWECSAGPQRTGADPYHRTWTFDAVGNRLTQTTTTRPETPPGRTRSAPRTGSARTRSPGSAPPGPRLARCKRSVTTRPATRLSRPPRTVPPGPWSGMWRASSPRSPPVARHRPMCMMPTVGGWLPANPLVSPSISPRPRFASRPVAASPRSATTTTWRCVPQLACTGPTVTATAPPSYRPTRKR